MPFVRLVVLLLTLCALCGAGSAYAATIWVALSEGGKEYGETAETIKTQLLQIPANEIYIKPWQEVAANPPANAVLVICIGSPAFAGLMESAANNRWNKTPLLATLLTRSAYETQRKRASLPTSAVFLDQPFSRQLALLHLAFPSLAKVGILLGSDSRQHRGAIEKAATDNGLAANVYQVDNEDALTNSLVRLLEENDMLLAVPDPLVFNNSNVQNILLATYRQRIPMMGFSPAYVRAGAVLALYSTPSQIGVQAARVARQLSAGHALPAAQGPQEFQIGVNINVSRSLGFRLSEEALRIELLSKEAR